MDRLIPYSPDVYQSLVAGFNLGLWPGQLIGTALVWLIFICARRGGATNARSAILVAGGMWMWTGQAFLHGELATLNWAAEWIGFAFIAKGLWLVGWAFATAELDIVLSGDKRASTGLMFLVMATVLHPIMIFAAGAPLQLGHYVGVFPMPTVLATLAVFCLIRPLPPRILLAVPLAWSIYDGLTAWTLGLTLDINLPIVAVAAITYLALSRGPKAPDETA